MYSRVKEKRQVVGVLVLTISCEKALQNILNATDYQLLKLDSEQQCGKQCYKKDSGNRNMGLLTQLEVAANTFKTQQK